MVQIGKWPFLLMHWLRPLLDAIELRCFNHTRDNIEVRLVKKLKVQSNVECQDIFVYTFAIKRYVSISIACVENQLKHSWIRFTAKVVKNT